MLPMKGFRMKKVLFWLVGVMLCLTQAQAQLSEDSLTPFRPRYAFPIQKIRLDHNVDLAYAELGKKNAPHTIVFVHGLGGSMAQWEYNVIPLSKYHRCIVIDLPGYGASGRNFDEPTADYLTFYAEVVIEFIQKIGLKYPVLAGHGMGAQVAINATVKAPSKFSKLILVAPSGVEVFSDSSRKTILNAATPAFFKKQTDIDVRESFRKNFHRMPASTEKIIQDRLLMPYRQGFERYCTNLSQATAAMLNYPIAKDLDYIALPTLMVWGKQDGIIPNKVLHPTATADQIAEQAHTLIRPGKVTIVNDAGHWVQYEKPVAFNMAIMDFLITKK